MRHPAMPYAFDIEKMENVWAAAPGSEPGDRCRADPYVKYS